jgi:hypothetical protein
MDPAKVLMLGASAAMQDLPPRLEALAKTREWWVRLENTPEDSLDADQKEMIQALGVELPREEDRVPLFDEFSEPPTTTSGE